jgi:hypothetical protein
MFFEPPEDVNLAGHRVLSQIVTVDTVISPSLPTGHLVSGTIVDDGGFPVDNCDLDFFDMSSGERIYTPRDNSDADGTYSVMVPPDTFAVVFKPTDVSGAARDTVLNVIVDSDVTLDATLQRLFNQAIELLPSEVSIFPGDQYSQGITIYNNDLSARRIQVAVAALLPSGKVFPVLQPFPANGVNLPGGGQRSGSLSIQIPPNLPGDFGVTLKGFILDHGQGSILGDDSTPVHILNPGNPLLRLSPFEGN